MKNKYLLQALVVAILGVGIVGWSYGKLREGVVESGDVGLSVKGGEFKEIVVGDKQLKVEMAVTSVELEKGLGDRDEIGADGMLFVMPYRTRPEFWMKGMKFPLDFVWIDCGTATEQSCEVVDTTEGVAAPESASEYLPRYSPSEPATHVLEVKAGWVKEQSLQIGDKVEL